MIWEDTNLVSWPATKEQQRSFSAEPNTNSGTRQLLGARVAPQLEIPEGELGGLCPVAASTGSVNKPWNVILFFPIAIFNGSEL